MITKKRIFDFIEEHPESKSGLEYWYRIVSKTNYVSFVELRKTFPSADIVDNKTIFNVGGNKVRIIAAIHYNRKKVYIRYVLTHKEYDKGKWR